MEIKTKEKFSFNVLPEKEIKSLAILELIRKNKAITRKDISEITGIAPVSVFNYMKDYIKENLILDGGIDVSTGGRKPELFELNANENYVIGIEISETRIRALMMDIGLSISKDIKQEIELGRKEDIEKKCADIIGELIGKCGVSQDKIKAVGVGLSEKINPSAVESLKNNTGLQVFLGSRAVCGAFGERYLNDAASVEDLLCVWTDLGKAVILKGENLRPTTPEESKYLSPWHKSFGITRMAAREVSRGVGTQIVSLAGGKIENINDDVVIKAARDGDEVALNIVYSVGVNIATRIAYLINIFGPQAVVLGGGLEKTGDLVLKPLEKVIDKLALKSRAGTYKIILSGLGDDAVSIGAASLAIREIFLRA